MNHFNRYINEAENFSGFGGDEYWDFDAANVDLMADGGAAPVAIAEAPAQTPRPYSLVIQNTNPTAATAVLFGKNKFLLATNFGSDTGVIITPSYSDVEYVEMLQQSGSQPFDTSLIRIQSSNSTQITQILNVTSKDANGQVFTDPIITQNYFSSMQFQSGILDAPVRLTINENSYITFTVLASTTLTMTFFPEAKTNIARALGGKSPVKLYGSPQVPVLQAVAGLRKPSSYPATNLISARNA